MFPRTRHRYQLSELLPLIRHCPDGVPNTHIVEVRSVIALSDSEEWYNLGTILRLSRTRDWNAKPRRIDLDRVLLLSWATDPEHLGTVDELCAFLTSWRREINDGKAFAFQEHLNFHHYAARNRWMDGPGWVFDLYERDPERGSYSGPSGPFLHSHHDIFAESIEALATEWLGLTEETNQSTLRHNYYVIVPDQRGSIENIRVEDESILLSVDASPNGGPLFCALRTVSSGRVERQVRSLENATAVFRFPSSTTDVEFWLLTQDGEWLDRYSENALSSTPSYFGVLSQPPTEIDPSFVDLKRALDSGETSQTEFKEFIKISRGNDKAAEILKTAAAFANSEGGALYIGINDNVEPVGVDPAMKKEYGSECNGDISAMEHAYVRDIRKLIAEGVDPAPVLTTEWVSFTHFRILRIDVPKGPSKPYTLASTGEIFVRRGANNKTLRQADYPHFFGSQSSTENAWSLARRLGR